MSDEAPKPYVIKRVKKIVKGGHHGGAWKIAYADFVTAMMAFFLLMWLLALMNKFQRQGVAEYFQKPFKEVFQNHGKTPDLGIDKDKDRDKDKDKDKDKNKDKDKAKEKPHQIVETDQDIQEKQVEQMKVVMRDLQNKLNADPEMAQFKNSLNFKVTADGLRIEMRDLENKPMFSEGKADFQKYATKVMSWLSHELNHYPSQIMIVGHTDGVPYNGGEAYTNWELSADRANATRRALIDSGMEANKIIRVAGTADQDLLDAKNIDNPANRRIDIIVLTDQAKNNMPGR